MNFITKKENTKSDIYKLIIKIYSSLAWSYLLSNISKNDKFSDQLAIEFMKSIKYVATKIEKEFGW